MEPLIQKFRYIFKTTEGQEFDTVGISDRYDAVTKRLYITHPENTEFSYNTVLNYRKINLTSSDEWLFPVSNI